MNRVVLCGYDQLSCVAAERIEPVTGSAELLAELSASDGASRSLRSGSGSLGDHAITNGVVLDLSTLRSPLSHAGWPGAIDLDEITLRTHADGSASVRAGALVPWRRLVKATLAKGWIVPSIVTGPDITIGGSVSAGSISRFSHVWGCEHASVLSIDALFPNGKLVTDIRVDGPTTSDLFRALIAGHGWIGVILAVEFRLRRVAVPSELADVSRTVVAETRVSDKQRGSAGSRVWWKERLDELALAGRVARELLARLPDRGFDSPIHERARGVFDGLSTVGFVTRDEMHSVRYSSRYIARPTTMAPPLPIYEGPTFLRKISELALSLPIAHEAALLIYQGQLAAGTYHNEVDPFVFFFEGNTLVREAVNGKQRYASLGAASTAHERALEALAREGMSAQFGAFLPQQGLPGTMYAIQQTHVMPDSESAAQLLLYMHERARAMALVDRATLFDLLYLPGDLRGPYLSSAGKHGGFAVTVAWQAIHDRAEAMREEQALAEALALECARLGGHVSLLKNNYAPAGVVKAGLDAKDRSRFLLVKQWADPRGTLRNPMFERHLR